jgi:DNA-binding beta-propeller fold protein YncE
MRLRLHIALLASMVAASAMPAAAMPASAKVLQSRYLFSLADVNGMIRSSWVSLAVDRQSRELFVADSGDGTVRVYRDNGMEVQCIGGDDKIGNVFGVAVKEDGDLFVLARKDERTVIVHTDFRGQLIAPLALQGVPDGFAEGFKATGIRYADGKLYIVDHGGLKVLVTDADGRYAASYDLQKLIKFEEKERDAVAMRGFNVDAAGDLLFTVSSLFRAYVVTPAGEVKSFGVKGSSPGKFNIVGGIAADESGYLYVTDLLRAVVMVFDPQYEFVGEFGYRGWSAGKLISPLELAVSNGELFVAQSGRRGVSAYRVAVRASEELNRQ